MVPRRQLARANLSEADKKWWRWQRSYGLCRTLVEQAEEADLVQLYRWSATASGRRELRTGLACFFTPGIPESGMMRKKNQL